ncbi:MAG: hypothetical protein H6704_27085 [Myxococcales bacterium]|nr:hypothetical protein [Myxococcales bacterium]
MKPLVTVLYEDAPVGHGFVLHDLVLRMVEDDVNGQIWRLEKEVLGNPRKGVDNVLRDCRQRADLLAGEGWLFALVDGDKLVDHVNRHPTSTRRDLLRDASAQLISDAVAESSDAPDKVRVFLLHPNMEGLLHAIGTCAPGEWPTELAAARDHKDRLCRDIVLKKVALAARLDLRACVRRHQPGLDALVEAIATAWSTARRSPGSSG